MTLNSSDRKGRSLEMLYSIVSSINLIDDQEKMCLRILEVLKAWIGAQAISLYRCGDNNTMTLVVSLGFDSHIPQTCYLGCPETCPCAVAIETGHIKNHLAANTCCGKMGEAKLPDNALRLVSVPVQTRNRILGIINLLISDERLSMEEDWQVLLTSIGQNLGLAIQRSEFEEGSERLSRMEERAYLAHELHDSLAQTLASIRYHLRILDNAYQVGEGSKVSSMLTVVENSVEEANKELRDLISRFRVPLESRSLIPAIESVVQRFKEETGTKIIFQNSADDIQFPTQIELQIVRIIQEALANIRKHAKAKTVRVMLSRDKKQMYHVLIEDDGVGFDHREIKSNQGAHIGLSIMSERAIRISGELDIESTKSEGTSIHLVFS